MTSSMPIDALPLDLTGDLDGLVDVIREDATLRTLVHDDPGMVGAPWTEDAMLRVLWRHFTGQSWAATPQVTVNMADLEPANTGLSQWEKRRQGLHAAVDAGLSAREVYNDVADRRIDMLAVRKPRRTDLGPLESLAIEVKVTRADFLQDVKNPAKQRAWRKAATRHAYAVPAGLVTADEVPEGSGLLAVKHSADGWGSAEWVRRAPYIDRHAPQLPPRVLLATMWRIASLEGHTRGWVNTPLAAQSPQELRATTQAAQTAAERATKALNGLEGKMNAWRDAYVLLAKDGHPCHWCGQSVKPLNPTSEGSFRRWRHLDGANDEPCALAETAVLEEKARAAYEAADESDRDWQIRNAARPRVPSEVREAVEREPWRAFLGRDYRDPSKITLTGPKPADVLPEGATTP